MHSVGRLTLVLSGVLLAACGSKHSGSADDGEGGYWVNESGGASFGGRSGGTGGRGDTGGVRAGGTGGRSSGGTGDAGTANGGVDAGGTSAAGTDAGGTESGGGGANPGGADTGGADTGGTTAGGTTTGGAPTGGTATGGTATGGTATGGTATGGSGGVVCQPSDMSTWQPPAYVPARRTAGACSDQEIQAYYSQCFWAFGDAKDCSPFEAGGPSADCGACLHPDALDASAWGPVLAVEPRVYLYESNVAGCIEILENGNTCAAKIQAADACARAACIDACATEVINAQAYQVCARQARVGVCQSYVAQTGCISSNEIQSACSGNGFEALFLALGKVFCG